MPDVTTHTQKEHTLQPLIFHLGRDPGEKFPLRSVPRKAQIYFKFISWKWTERSRREEEEVRCEEEENQPGQCWGKKKRRKKVGMRIRRLFACGIECVQDQ